MQKLQALRICLVETDQPWDHDPSAQLLDLIHTQPEVVRSMFNQYLYMLNMVNSRNIPFIDCVHTTLEQFII